MDEGLGLAGGMALPFILRYLMQQGQKGGADQIASELDEDGKLLPGVMSEKKGPSFMEGMKSALGGRMSGLGLAMGGQPGDILKAGGLGLGPALMMGGSPKSLMKGGGLGLLPAMFDW